MHIRYFIVFFIVLLGSAASCSREQHSITSAHQREANEFCLAHSIGYWEETGKIALLEAARATEKQNIFISEFRSKITSKAMKSIVYDQTKDMPAADFYQHLKEHIPSLTKQPFECEAIAEFYNAYP